VHGLEGQQVMGKDDPPPLEGGVWIDRFLPGYFSFLEGTTEPGRGFLELKLVEMLRWRQTWTAHFASGDFLHTEAISDSVRLAPTGPGLFHTTGVYTSTVHDAGRPVDWTHVSWAFNPVPPAVELQYRTGPQASPDITWSDWITPQISPVDPIFVCVVIQEKTECDSTLVGIESNRYLQYRAIFASEDASQGAALQDYELQYGIHAPAGTAVSMELAPLDLLGWETVVYTATVPVSTALQIDVLAADGTVLLADVGRDQDLSAIDPAEHPALKLRANLSTEADHLTPNLEAWGVRWQTPERVYLPLVAR
jgi:hypothetical protein